MPTPDNQEQLPELTKEQKEEIAFLIKAMWGALRAPKWTFKNRKDLEKLGEAIFAGKELRDLDDELYDRIFPHLFAIASHLRDTLRNQTPYHEITLTAAPALGASSVQTATTPPNETLAPPQPPQAPRTASPKTDIPENTLKVVKDKV